MDTCRRHNWQLDNNSAGYTCTECGETCTACTSPLRDGTPCAAPTDSGQPICPTCLDAARALPHHILDGYRHLPDIYAAIAGLHAIRYDHGRRTAGDDGTMPGGNILTMTSPGNSEAAGRNTWDPAALTDPEPVPTFLTRWEDEWRREKGDPLPETTNLDRTVAWLDQHTLWAARNLDSDTWGEYLNDARRLRATINRYTGLTQPPVREAAPCIDCSGTVTHHWDNNGLQDECACTRCGRTWPNSRAFSLAGRHALFRLPETHPDAELTLPEVLLIYPQLTRTQVDKWTSDREYITPVGTNARGQKTFRLADFTRKVDESA